MNMQAIRLNRAMREAEKFLEIARNYLSTGKEVLVNSNPPFKYTTYDKKLSGAIKRQSMELSNALIAYRNPK